ncbi:hypothetical protein [Pseudomonas luteola]|uniref:hypothetical protein n=1 Tax=Pseudomonas luteola TaxID=47886 RepID=UPI0012385E05|nr:hypothetical protein [Pseudomonas luteola]QEU28826.1 hypothetical protein FOB45_13970 [Pseudomonas luteola]
MKGLIINNGNPSAVTVEHDGKVETFKTFAAACEYADKITEKRFPIWPDDQQAFPFLESFDEERADLIGHNGPTAEHYSGVGAYWLREYNLLEAGQ